MTWQEMGLSAPPAQGQAADRRSLKLLWLIEIDAVC